MFPNLNQVLDSARRHTLIWLILVLCSAVFLWFYFAGLESISMLFLPKEYSNLQLFGQWWKLLSPSFIHYNVIHLGSNLFLWWFLGSKIEERSKLNLLAIFLVAALAGNLLQWWISGPKFGGLSGVVFAVFGFRLIAAEVFKIKSYKMELSFVGFFFLYFIVTSTGLVGNFAAWAHVGGLLSGILLALIIFRFGRASATFEA